jgi:hypothetical protein
MSIVFRVVSLVEAEQIRRTGTFEVVPQGCEGKHFADTIEAAKKFGEMLFKGQPFRIVQATIPNVAPSEYRWSNLDDCGPARYLSIEDLVGVRPIVLDEARS